MKKKIILFLGFFFSILIGFSSTSIASQAQPVHVEYSFYNNYEHEQVLGSIVEDYNYEPGDVFNVLSISGTENYYFRYQLAGYESTYWQGGLYCIIGGDNYETGVFTHEGWIDVRNAVMVNGPVDIYFEYYPYADFYYIETYLQNEDGTYPTEPTETVRKSGYIYQAYSTDFEEYENYTPDEESSTLSGVIPLRTIGEDYLRLRCYYTLNPIEEETTAPEEEIIETAAVPVETSPESEPESETPEPTQPVEPEQESESEVIESAAVPSIAETDPVEEIPETTPAASPYTRVTQPVVYTALPVPSIPPIQLIEQETEERESSEENYVSIQETTPPLASQPESLQHSKTTWALLNLILMIMTCLALVKKKDDKRKYFFLSIIVPILSILAFVFSENVRNTMVFVDKYTFLMIMLYLIQLLSRFLGKKEDKEEE